MSDWSFRRVLFRSLALAEAERIERGREMPAHAIGADQHHRADRIVRGALDLGGGQRGARLGGGGLNRDLPLLRIERGGQVVAVDPGPVLRRPARASLPLVDVEALYLRVPNLTPALRHN